MKRKDKRQFLKQFQPGGTLGQGEDTRVHRIRAAIEVHEWLTTLTAAERGLLLSQAYESTTAVTAVVDPVVTAVKISSKRSKKAGTVVTDVTPVVKYRPSRPSLRAGGIKRTSTERLALHVPALGVMEKTVPRGLGWRPERYDQTNMLLAQGDILLADGVNYRTAQGQIMGYKTAEALVRLGVLVPA